MRAKRCGWKIKTGVGIPNAIEVIVSAYVGLKDKAALDDLRMERRKPAVDLKARTGFDCRATIPDRRRYHRDRGRTWRS